MDVERDDGVGGAVHDLDRHGESRDSAAPSRGPGASARRAGAALARRARPGSSSRSRPQVLEIALGGGLRREDARDRGGRRGGRRPGRDVAGHHRAGRRLASRSVIRPSPPRPDWLGAPSSTRPVDGLRRVERPGQRHGAAVAVADHAWRAARRGGRAPRASARPGRASRSAAAAGQPLRPRPGRSKAMTRVSRGDRLRRRRGSSRAGCRWRRGSARRPGRAPTRWIVAAGTPSHGQDLAVRDRRRRGRGRSPAAPAPVRRRSRPAHRAWSGRSR